MSEANKAKFTEGEWYYSHVKGDSKKFVMCNGMRIATCPINSGRTNAKSNANLIAAAPEMYDVLSTIENDDGIIPEWLWDKIQTTLAKARGE